MPTAPLNEVLIASAAGWRLSAMRHGLRDLADEMFRADAGNQSIAVQDAAFSNTAVPCIHSVDTYSKLVHDEVEHVAIDKMANRIVATGVVPYPPGILRC